LGNSYMNEMLTVGDKLFLQKMIHMFNLPGVRVMWSDSPKKWPDIWCLPYEKPPQIVVTAEWKRQLTHERRKRLLHELVHLTGLDHGKINGLDYNTIPGKDTYTRELYKRLIHA
jgi:hypothetical protein